MNLAHWSIGRAPLLQEIRWRKACRVLARRCEGRAARRRSRRAHMIWTQLPIVVRVKCARLRQTASLELGHRSHLRNRGLIRSRSLVNHGHRPWCWIWELSHHWGRQGLRLRHVWYRQTREVDSGLRWLRMNHRRLCYRCR